MIIIQIFGYVLLSVWLIHGQAVNESPERYTSLPVMQEVTIETGVFMEGPMRKDGSMHNNLYERGYLPGQKPKTFFGQSTKAGQPYSRSPWNYSGKEGEGNQKQLFNYPPNTVDWILISLLSDSESLDPVCKTSAILLEDGSVMMDPNSIGCIVDRTKSYYVVIEHRNHLGVVSSFPAPVVDGTVSYDFRILGDNEAALSGLKIDGTGRKVMVAGNGDQNSSYSTSFTIDQADLKLWRAENGQNSKYLNMDLDLSGDVSVKDQELLFTNYGITTSLPIPRK